MIELGFKRLGFWCFGHEEHGISGLFMMAA
jgi:hypothetical protein